MIKTPIMLTLTPTPNPPLPYPDSTLGYPYPCPCPYPYPYPYPSDRSVQDSSAEEDVAPPVANRPVTQVGGLGVPESVPESRRWGRDQSPTEFGPEDAFFKCYPRR